MSLPALARKAFVVLLLILGAGDRHGRQILADHSMTFIYCIHHVWNHIYPMGRGKDSLHFQCRFMIDR